MAIQKSIPFTLEIKEVPPAPDFFPAIDPTAQAVLRGTVATFAVSFTAVAGYANPIALSVLGLPDGAMATFGVNPCQVTDIVSLTVTTEAAVGVYNLLVEATEVVVEPAGKK
jgi:hypothetical protein